MYAWPWEGEYVQRGVKIGTEVNLNDYPWHKPVKIEQSRRRRIRQLEQLSGVFPAVDRLPRQGNARPQENDKHDQRNEHGQRASSGGAQPKQQ